MARRPAKKKRQTAYVLDAQRHTTKVTVRMAPKDAARLRAIAARDAITLGELIASALDALDGKKKS